MQRAARLRLEQAVASSDVGSHSSLRPNPGHSTIFWRVFRSVTHKHELWIWFTLSYAMMKALHSPCHVITHKRERWIWFPLSYAKMQTLLRLAAVTDAKQAGELWGDTVQFIASSSALVLLTQNGNIYRPLTQTATCRLRRWGSKHNAENSQWICRTTTRSRHYWRQKQIRVCDVINKCKERREMQNAFNERRGYWVTWYVRRCGSVWTVCTEPYGSMSSLLQSTGSNTYVLVHIVGPLAATGHSRKQQFLFNYSVARVTFK